MDSQGYLWVTVQTDPLKARTVTPTCARGRKQPKKQPKTRKLCDLARKLLILLDA